MHASALAAVAFIAAVATCLAASIAGFIFNKKDKTGLALAALGCRPREHCWCV